MGFPLTFAAQVGARRVIPKGIAALPSSVGAEASGFRRSDSNVMIRSVCCPGSIRTLVTLIQALSVVSHDIGFENPGSFQEVAMSLRASIRLVSTVIALATASMIASVAFASNAATAARTEAVTQGG